MQKNIYLDVAAAAPVTQSALRAFHRAINVHGNPSAPHTDGREAKAILEEARTSIAHMAGAKPEALIFTSGATEANAIAIRGHVRARMQAGAHPRDLHLLYQEGSHASVYETMQALKKEGIDTESVPLKEGDIDKDALQKLVRPETTLISVEGISSETGMRLDTRGIRHVLDTFKAQGTLHIALHVDASQLPLIESFERTRLACDTLTLDAQKVGGVRGIGCLVFAPNVLLAPLWEGGGQERGLRSGTESPALAIAFATALEEAQKEKEAFVKRAAGMRSWLVHEITSLISNTVVNEGKRNAPHIVNISFLGRDTDYLIALLDERGFSVATRSSCETDSVEGSRAVLALTQDTERACSTLRVSWGAKTTNSALRTFVQALVQAVSFLDQHQL